MRREDTVQSILRAASILKSFTPNDLELDIAQISQKAGIPKTTSRRMAVTLAKTGLLEKSNRTGMFKIGPALYMQGNLYLYASDILREIRLVTSTLSELTDETITASVFNEEKGFVTYIVVEDSKYHLRWDVRIGTNMPAYASSMGKAFLSELTDAQIDSLFPDERLRPLTEKTIATKAELKMELAQIRKTGISIDREGCYEGVEGIASLIRDDSGKAAAGMTIAALTVRMNEAKRKKYAKLVKLGASLASYRLGYYDSVNPVHDIEEIRAWWQQNQAVSAPHKTKIRLGRVSDPQ